jgi:hypothetical protein
MVVEPFINKGLDQTLNITIQFSFGLPFELRLWELNANDCDEAFSDIVPRQVLFHVFEKACGLAVIVDGSSERRPKSRKVSASINRVMNVIPLGGFSSAVQFSCGKLPVNVSCSFSQASVTPDGVHPSVVMLTIKTSGTLASLTGSQHLWAIPSTLAFAGLLLPFGKRRRLRNCLAMLGLIVMGIYGAGCGGGSSSSHNIATPGSFNITIAATSGGAPAGKSVPLSVTIVR